MPRRNPKAKPNVYAFIDSQNLNLGVQKMGWKMDWRRFRKYLQDKYNVTHAYMFIGYMVENESLYEHMHELGYLIALKPTLDINQQGAEDAQNQTPQPLKAGEEEHAKPVVKGNIDADLARICRFGVRRNYASGSHLVTAGVPSQGMFVLLQGAIAVSLRDGLGRSEHEHRPQALAPCEQAVAHGVLQARRARRPGPGRRPRAPAAPRVRWRRW